MVHITIFHKGKYESVQAAPWKTSIIDLFMSEEQQKTDGANDLIVKYKRSVLRHNQSLFGAGVRDNARFDYVL